MTFRASPGGWRRKPGRMGSSGGISAAAVKAALFSAGEKGVFYDPSNFASMFQDDAGTTPVTAVGQSVGRINDLSGNGLNATQAVAGSRPLLQQVAGKFYLDFDGVDDFLVTPSIDFTATDKMTVWAGARKSSDAAVGILCELSVNSNSQAGSFGMGAPATAGATLSLQSRGATAAALALASGFVAPITVVVAGQGDISAPLSSIKVNGGIATSTSAAQGGGNYGNYPLYIGRRAGTTLPFIGRIYSLIVRGAASSAAQVTTGEQYANSKTGAY